MKLVQKNQSIPEKLKQIWGVNFQEAIQYISQNIVGLGYIGPLTWKQKFSIPFCFDVSPTIRVVLSISKSGGNSEAALFDGVATIWSKTIHNKTTDCDPWGRSDSGHERWNKGYVPCLTYRLSHLKWAEKEGEVNPVWAMTLKIGGERNAKEWLMDYESLLHPIVANLKTDKDLVRVMESAAHYVRPRWVKSDGPGFVRMEDLLLALQR